jgi:phosphoribosyl-ATP pyrophosphohydrolase/phosphoribosyl-AMP cyclohydrolase
MALSLDLDALDFTKGSGLVTVVAQDVRTGDVLMVAHADREALARTLETGEMHYRSRSRGLWRKGDTSGNVQRVVSLHPDCDGDAVLARVRPAGPACHTGADSCFTVPQVAPPPADTLAALDATIAARAAAMPAGAGTEASAAPSYTQRLLADRNLRLKKIGEEAAELLVAVCDGDRDRAASEAADLVYHTLVALHAIGVTLDDVRMQLAGRAK